jgi:redox-sensitive bicupin YhaK (pirin superfamily)
MKKEVFGTRGVGSNHWVGDGFPVRNLFPSNGVEVSPFLMLDYAGPMEFQPTNRPRGVDEHPHRGFETVTIAYQGAVEHRDSAGNSGVIFPGDVQWMTAASGVVHEEKHERKFAAAGGVFEMVQLWVNLPKAYKMTQPRYQAITSNDIPTVDVGEGGFARVIAGELNGARGPAKTFTPVEMFDVRLSTGGKGDITLPEGHNAAVILLRGDVTVNGKERLQGEAKMALLSEAGTTFTLEATEGSIVLVLAGEPINEPVASYGPFVMNTQAELLQAMQDYRSGKMGHLSPVAV